MIIFSNFITKSAAINILIINRDIVFCHNMRYHVFIKLRRNKMKKTKIELFLAVAMLVLFLALIVVLKTVDVAAIGPLDSSIGLSGVNGYFFNTLGESELFYNITELIGLFALAVAAFFALLGAYQLIKRKSIKSIDRDILILAGFYVTVVVFYVLFEVVVINFRPVLEDGALAASFPSSHTMLTLCIMGTAFLQAGYRVPKKSVRILLQILSVLIMLVMAVGRLASGVHWFTDILGSVFLSVSLILIYDVCVKRFSKE